jgi:hypothetical protein
VTLITLGALFALQNFTPYGFSQTWPVLLIVFGLLSLLGRMGPQTPPPPPQYAYQPPQWQSQPWQAPPPAGQAAPGGYRATSYAQGAADAASPSDPAKGGFGSSAPPKPDPSSENSTPGGAV